MASAIVQYVCAHEGYDAPPEEELLALLQTQPSRFLARWVHHIPPRLQQYFDQLDDPEVAVVRREIKRQAEHELKPSTIRNRSAGTVHETRSCVRRRYVHMVRVLEKGDYFTEELMKERDPRLYHQYIGRYLSEAEANAYTTQYTKRSLAEHLMDRLVRHHDDGDEYEDGQRSRKTDEDDSDSEHDSEDAALRPHASKDQAKRPPPQRHAAEEVEYDDDDRVYDEELARARRFLGETQGQGQADEKVEEEDDEDDETTEARATSSRAAAPAPHMSEEEKLELREDFARLMRERFLRGEDHDFDYTCCDRNLDLDVGSRSYQRDAEEAYFDDDDGYLDE